MEDGLDSPRNFNESPINPDEGNDRIVLLKINMDSAAGAVN